MKCAGLLVQMMSHSFAPKMSTKTVHKLISTGCSVTDENTQVCNEVFLSKIFHRTPSGGLLIDDLKEVCSSNVICFLCSSRSSLRLLVVLFSLIQTSHGLILLIS